MVNSEAVFSKMILTDKQCKESLERLRVTDVIGLESLYEEIKYREMWSSCRVAYRKKRR